MSAQFDEFWKNYPARHGQKKDKKKAVDVWARKKLDAKSLEIMLGLSAQVAHYTRCKKAGVFVPEFPDPFRWLRDERWLDEVEAPPKTNGSNVEQNADNAEPWAASAARSRELQVIVGREHPEWGLQAVRNEATRRWKAEGWESV